MCLALSRAPTTTDSNARRMTCAQHAQVTPFYQLRTTREPVCPLRPRLTRKLRPSCTPRAAPARPGCGPPAGIHFGALHLAGMKKLSGAKHSPVHSIIAASDYRVHFSPLFGGKLPAKILQPALMWPKRLIRRPGPILPGRTPGRRDLTSNSMTGSPRRPELVAHMGTLA